MLADLVRGHALVDGAASGAACVLSEPLSLWGGFDSETGLIIDIHHPEHGQSIAGQIVVMHSGRGSSSASSVLAEAVRLGTAPAAFVLVEPDEIIVLGALVGFELYSAVSPVVVVPASAHAQIVHGQRLTIAPGGEIRPS